MSKTRQRLEHFRFGVGNVEHGHSHGHDATEGGIAKLKQEQTILKDAGVCMRTMRFSEIQTRQHSKQNGSRHTNLKHAV
jgi:hypothetical protein